ncbi:MAG TPA: hypothetical protein PKH10_10610, partial [bacterium]|nr:hypothetical protein [bacterium]
ACNLHTAKNDADTVTADDDMSHMEGDTLTSDDAAVSNDETIDEVLSDNDAVVCPDLKVYENVKAAGFPFKDGNGKITFCRPGCDAPTENDPQCTRNLWDWMNWYHYKQYLAGTNTLGGSYNYKECYPWPCVLPELKSVALTHSPCDRDVTPGADLSADRGTLYDLRVENGMVGGEMKNGGVNTRTLFYDIEKDEFISIASSGTSTGYRAGRLIFYSTANDVMRYPEEGLGNTYIFSAKKTGMGYRYEVIYDDEQHQADFSRPPLVGEKWVVLNIRHRATGSYEVLYSKVDEWTWHSLTYSKVYEGNVVDNYLAFINDNREVYVCDLDKLPYNPAKECIRIDREGEKAYQPRLNEENKNQLVYFAGVGEYGITFVDLSNRTPQYTLLPITPSDPQPLGTYPHQFKGNLILYSELFLPPNEEIREDFKACFYRLDTKKQYCPKTPAFEDGRYDMGFNSFDGNYQLWKAPASINARFRDIACYCEKEGICPFEGMTVKSPVPRPTLRSTKQTKTTPPEPLFARTTEDTCRRIIANESWDKEGYCGPLGVDAIFRSSTCPPLSGDPKKAFSECVEWLSRSRAFSELP